MRENDVSSLSFFRRLHGRWLQEQPPRDSLRNLRKRIDVTFSVHASTPSPFRRGRSHSFAPEACFCQPRPTQLTKKKKNILHGSRLLAGRLATNTSVKCCFTSRIPPLSCAEKQSTKHQRRKERRRVPTPAYNKHGVQYMHACFHTHIKHDT